MLSILYTCPHGWPQSLQIWHSKLSFDFFPHPITTSSLICILRHFYKCSILLISYQTKFLGSSLAALFTPAMQSISRFNQLRIEIHLHSEVTSITLASPPPFFSCTITTAFMNSPKKMRNKGKTSPNPFLFSISYWSKFIHMEVTFTIQSLMHIPSVVT